MKTDPRPTRRPFRRLTTRFILLYVCLVLLPTLVSIGIYTDNLVRQYRNEARYAEQLMLGQTAAYMGNYLMRAESVISSFQTENTLLNLLENSFASPSEELLACVTYVQPMLTSVLATYPFTRDIYIYRYEPSHITQSDMVFNLPMIDQFPYDPALLEGDQMVSRFLAVDPATVRHLEDVPPASAQYVCLQKIYNRSYASVVGVLEVQIDLDRVLTLLDIAPNGGDLYLTDGAQYYPIARTATSAHMDWANPLSALPASAGTQTITEAVKDTGLSFVCQLHGPAPMVTGALLRNLAMAFLLLLLPTGIVCAYVYRYVARLMRLRDHIKRSDSSTPTFFLEAPRDDELGELVAAYNDMIKTIYGLIDQVRKAEQLKNAATYYAMSSQVNPHFMFNTLENIRMQIELENYQDASQMLFILGRFLRYNISLRRESVLSDELNHVEHYLMIYRYRAQHIIRFSIDLPEDVSIDTVRCPFCMLQPIVENALKHGIRDGEALMVQVAVRAEGDDLLITVSDNGCGMPEAEIDALNQSFEMPEQREQSTDTHVGLGNVNARVKYFYGNAYGISVHSARPVGLVVAVRIARQPQQDGLERPREVPI